MGRNTSIIQEPTGDGESRVVMISTPSAHQGQNFPSAAVGEKKVNPGLMMSDSLPLTQSYEFRIDVPRIAGQIGHLSLPVWQFKGSSTSLSRTFCLL